MIPVNQAKVTIQRGDIFSLLGPNGAGKSTTISMLCGLLKPTDGDILILGQEVEEAKTMMGAV
jgi:ABC-2 type transport system ATP-binding protein